MNERALADALRAIAKGLNAAADALVGPLGGAPQEDRIAQVLREWGSRGLSRNEASELFRRHGFAPQTSGGWAKGDWIQSRRDGLRYLTARSHGWLAEYERQQG